MKFVLDKHGNFNINNELCNLIFDELNEEEKKEIIQWQEKCPDKSKAQIISILYGTRSQRRRMNPRLVKAVEKYIAKHPLCNYTIYTLKDETKYIDDQMRDNGCEYIIEYGVGDIIPSDATSIDKWINQKPISSDEFDNDNNISERDALKSNIKEPKVTLIIAIKRVINNIKRKLSRKNKTKEDNLIDDKNNFKKKRVY